MSDIVSEYCAIAEEGAAFDDVRLARLRERMTDADIIKVENWLRAAAETDFKEARALEVYGRIKFEGEGNEAAAREAFARVMVGQPKPKLQVIPGSADTRHLKKRIESLERPRPDSFNDNDR